MLDGLLTVLAREASRAALGHWLSLIGVWELKEVIAPRSGFN
jgi:hypothetical protein